MPGDDGKSISVAISHYQRSQIAHVSLFNILEDPRIGEIIILDDGSKTEDFNNLIKKISPFSEKVKLYRREENWGPFATKLQAVELCKSEWVVLLDSDNTLFSRYLDAIFTMEIWEEDTMYCPSYAFPSFDFRGKIDNEKFNLENAYRKIGNSEFISIYFNVGNFFVNRERYIKAIKPFWNYNCYASDAIFAVYLWLASGNFLTMNPDFIYFHRIHKKSTYKKTYSYSQNVLKAILYRIEKGIIPDNINLDKDFGKIRTTWLEPESVI